MENVAAVPRTWNPPPQRISEPPESNLLQTESSAAATPPISFRSQGLQYFPARLDH